METFIKKTTFENKIYENIMLNNKHKIEGGDFIPYHKNLIFIGCGLRTKYRSIKHLLKNKLFGSCKEIIIVKDDHDKNQDRMHLDTVFNVIGEKVALYLKFEKDLKNYERNIEIWKKNEYNNEYEKDTSYKTFREYLKKKENWTIIDVTKEEQLNYMCNVISLGKNDNNKQHVIVSVHNQLNMKLQKYYNHQNVSSIVCEYINYRPITRMYGAAHCNTQVFR